MQCDPETMDWEEWPPFISPLGCMGWLFSIPGPSSGHVNATNDPLDTAPTATPARCPGGEPGGCRGPCERAPPPARRGEDLTHRPQAGRGAGAVLRWLPYQLVDGGQLVDSSAVNFVHGGKDGTVGGRRLQLAPARGNQAAGQPAAGGMEPPCPGPGLPSGPSDFPEVGCGAEKLPCTAGGSAALAEHRARGRRACGSGAAPGGRCRRGPQPRGQGQGCSPASPRCGLRGCSRTHCRCRSCCCCCR